MRGKALIAVCVVVTPVVSLTTGCNEKKADTPMSATKRATPAPCNGLRPAALANGSTGSLDAGCNGGDESGNIPDDPTATDQQGSTAAFNLCKDGLAVSAKLSGFATLVNDLCGADSKLVTLRKAENVYTGGAPNVSKTLNPGGTESQMRLYTSAIYSTSAEDYWALIKLQFTKPGVYKTVYDYDHDASMSEVVPSGSSVTYRYQNDSGEGGAVDYNAKTDFIVLKAGQAYVAATKETKMNEMMKSLTGLIVINRKSNGKVEVFTVSDQTYQHADGEATAVTNRALTALGNEQKRAFNNAGKASQAKGLLGQ